MTKPQAARETPCADIEPHDAHDVPHTWRGIGEPFRCPGVVARESPTRNDGPWYRGPARETLRPDPLTPEELEVAHNQLRYYGRITSATEPERWLATIDALRAATPDPAEPTCCELACYEDPGCACDGCTPDPADLERLYEAVRPEYREAGAGGDGYNPDVLARRAAERIAARLRAATPDPAEPEHARGCGTATDPRAENGCWGCRCWCHGEPAPDRAAFTVEPGLLTDIIEQAIFETGTGLEAAMLATERILALTPDETA